MHGDTSLDLDVVVVVEEVLFDFIMVAFFVFILWFNNLGLVVNSFFLCVVCCCSLFIILSSSSSELLTVVDDKPTIDGFCLVSLLPFAMFFCISLTCCNWLALEICIVVDNNIITKDPVAVTNI